MEEKRVEKVTQEEQVNIPEGQVEITTTQEEDLKKEGVETREE